MGRKESNQTNKQLSHCGLIYDNVFQPLPREDHNGPGIGYKVEWKNKPAPYVTTNDWKEVRINKRGDQ